MTGSGFQLASFLLALAIVAVVLALVWWLAQRVRPLLTVLAPTRATLLTLLAGFALLFLAGQGRELIDGLDAAPVAHVGWFALALFYWSFQCWHWSRVELYLAFGTDRAAWGERAAAITLLPRLYGIAVHVMALLAILLSARATGPVFAILWPIAAVLASLALFLLLVGRRLALLEAIEHRGGMPGGLARALTTRRIEPGAPLREAIPRLAPLSLLVLVGSLAFFLCNALLGGLWPVETGAFFGSAAIVFGGLGSWVAVLSILALASRAFRFPVLAGFVLARVLLGLLVDEHAVRSDPASAWAAPEADPRPTLAAEVERWRSLHAAPGSEPVPVVLVATAGGGLRAAWWTATVLAGLLERHPGLERHLVAVSGVSGGSLGAAVVAACLAREQARAARRPPFEPARIGACARGVLANDFLAPTLVAFLYTDVLGPALTAPLGWGGRAVALENAWAAAFDRLGDHERRPDGSWWNPLAGRFLELDAADPQAWRPILFLNATHEERGRRVIASRVRIEAPPFQDAWDLHRLSGRDLWTVTAVHNSARFSFVSPAGLLRGADGTVRGHLLDGGYFENFGATTLLEAWRGMEAQLADPNRFLPIVIQISSDPGLDGRDRITEATCQTGASLPIQTDDGGSPWTALNELLAPLAGILATREARGLWAVRELARTVRCPTRPAGAPEPAFVHLAMCGMDGRSPALGWVLDSRSRAAIEAALAPGGCNAGELAELDRALAAASPRAGGRERPTRSTP